MIDFSKIKPEEPTCPKCGGKLMVRQNSKNGNQFWGCENFFKTGCTYTKTVELDKKGEKEMYEEFRSKEELEDAKHEQKIFDAAFCFFAFALMVAACPSVAEMFWAVACSVACLLKDDRNGR